MSLPIRSLGIATFAALLVMTCPATLVYAAEWFMMNGKSECERAGRTDFATPDDFFDYLQQRDRYRSRQVTRDFTGRPQIVTFTDVDNHQTVFFADEDTCQRALRRSRNGQRSG